MSALRVGIAGYGLAGEVFHAPLVRAVAGLDLAAIVTSDASRQIRARAAHPGATICGQIDQAWSAIDLLVVAAPNAAHLPLALAAIERGLPVVIDKPLAPTVAAAEQLLSAGGRVTVFQNRRWDGDFLTAERLLREGALGAPLRLESRFERFRPTVADGAWRERPGAVEGGGLLLDLGSHLVDQALRLFGPVRTVYAELDRRRPGAQVEDDVFIALEHRGGERSHLRMSSVAALAGPRLRLSGTAAAFEADELDPQEHQLAAGLVPGDPGFGLGDGGALIGDGEGQQAVGLERGAYERFYEGVVEWLTGHAAPPVDPYDSLAGLRVLEAARASATTKATTELEEA